MRGAAVRGHLQGGGQGPAQPQRAAAHARPHRHLHGRGHLPEQAARGRGPRAPRLRFHLHHLNTIFYTEHVVFERFNIIIITFKAHLLFIYEDG